MTRCWLLLHSVCYVLTFTIAVLFPGLEAVGELCCDVTGFGWELFDDVSTIGGPFCSAELFIPSRAGAENIVVYNSYAVCMSMSKI